jgi:hypothetical protein
MEKQTVYAKLKRMESFLKQVPEDIRTLYKFRVIHTDTDFVGLGYNTAEGNFVGMSADVIKEVSFRQLSESCTIVDIETQGAHITLYGNVTFPMSHISLI